MSTENNIVPVKALVRQWQDNWRPLKFQSLESVYRMLMSKAVNSSWSGQTLGGLNTGTIKEPGTQR